jgi:PAS domain S-box-containing protein
MAGRGSSYDELKRRAAGAEAVVEALREGQVDAVVGKQSVALLRLAEAEKRLRHNQARLQVALEASGGGVYEHSVPWDESCDHDDRCVEILGYCRDELPPRDRMLDWLFERVHPEDRAPLERACRDLIEERSVRYDVEVRLRHKRGHWVWVRGVSQPTERDQQGCVRRLVGVMFDVTEQRGYEVTLRESRAAALNMMEDAVEARRHTEEAQQELRALNESLEARVAERTTVSERRARDLRRLAAELSEAEHRERKRLARLLHDDMQQLLLAVKLRLPVLVEGPQDQIKQHVEKLDELVGQCVTTSRNLTQELSPPVLQCGTLPEVMEWLGGWFGDQHGLTVAVDTHGELPSIPEHLRVFLFQAVRELLFNVVKHSGKLEARVGLSFEDGYLRIQIEDDGDGFDPPAVELQLREPAGFGLFNIRERLEALLGRVEIQCTPRGGACFRLVVPTAEDSQTLLQDAEPQRVKMATHPVRKSHREDGVLRLLVADDHAVVREGFVSLLDRQPDFKVIGQAADGEEAVQQAEALRPDAIIMDIDMPNVGGVEATRRITERQPEVAVVGLSLHEDPSMARTITEAGAHAFVSKHAPAKDLIEAIRRACDARDKS